MKFGLKITADQELLGPADTIPKGYVLVKRWADMDSSLYAPWPIGVPWRWCYLVRQWFLWRWYRVPAWERELVLAAHQGRRQEHAEHRERFDRDIKAAKEEGYKSGFSAGWKASLAHLEEIVKKGSPT